MSSRRDQPQLSGLDPSYDRQVAIDAARWVTADGARDAAAAIGADAVVVDIHVVEVRGEAPARRQRITLVAGEGIVGERRRAAGNPRHQQVTLVEHEAVSRAIELCGAFSAADTRRNVLTRGVALNHLVGRDFVIGEVVLRGIELCDPCARLARFTSRAFEKALVNRGGLRAEIISGGDIVVGAVVRLAAQPELQGRS